MDDIESVSVYYGEKCLEWKWVCDCGYSTQSVFKFLIKFKKFFHKLSNTLKFFPTDKNGSF